MQHVRNWADALPLDKMRLPPDLAFKIGQSLDKLPPDLASKLATANPLRMFTRDNYITFDQATLDSAGAFLVGELERLDPTIHEPLVAVTWPRDIDLRTDVQMGDTSTSFTQSTFGASGTIQPGTGINWASSEITVIPRATLDITKIVNPLDLWTMEVAYTVPELEQARRIGRPIDAQQLTALNLKHQMDIDQLVYVGDPVKGTTGIANNAGVTAANVAVGAASSTRWALKTPAEILADFNDILTAVWATTGYAMPPNKVLIAPKAFGYITGAIVSSAGNRTILDFLLENNIMTAERGVRLDVKACKWLDKANINGVGGSPATYDRMIAYTQMERFVRFPMVPLVPMAPQFQGIWVKVPYYGKLGVVEWVYPETAAYRDGIN